MLNRIVKMSFHTERTGDFLHMFNEKKHLISGFDGCKGVKLLRDIHNPDTFFTYSIWENESYLDAYRKSDLFDAVWNTVKQWFSEKPEAWSTKEIE